ncbi:MAG: MFS transporter, partial [Acidobacteriota bacterium]|nr:MFS transporter [Acidobacteriota bacterium]
YAWIPFFVAGVGSVGGGSIARIFLNIGMTITSARKSAVTVAAAMMMMAIPAVMVSKTSVSIALVSIAMAGYTAALASMLAMPADVFPAEACASVYGLASMGSGFGGMVFMLATGWLVDRYSYLPAFWLFGLIPLVCVAILWILLGPLTRDQSLQEAIA